MYMLYSSDFFVYQDDLVTPVTWPLDANLRKQIRQIPNLRINAFGRPQRGHLLYFRTANFGVLFAFAMRDFLAKLTSSLLTSKVIGNDSAFERHAKKFEKASGLIIILSGGYNADV